MRDSESAIAVLLLEGDAMPAVHGKVFNDNEYPEGEFSFLDVRAGDIVAARDILGTRPLYVENDGEFIASDHRFLASPEKASLLPPGAIFDRGTRSFKVRSIGRVPPPATVEEAAGELASLIDRSVRRRVEGERRVAVSFSGGLDSSLLAHTAARYSEVLLCSVFSTGSRDEKETERVAEILGLSIETKRMNAAEVRNELRALDLPFPATSMDEALWCIYSSSARLARENGVETILLGQLADELFGGYYKYMRGVQQGGVALAQRMMEEDVAGCGRVGFIRDEQACSRYLEPRFPFADEGVARFALSVPVEFKVGGGRRKHVLREAAKLLGVPEEVTEMPKKAAQYSSGVLKMLH